MSLSERKDAGVGDTDGNIVIIDSISKATVSGVRRTFLLGKTIYLNRVMVKRDQKKSWPS